MSARSVLVAVISNPIALDDFGSLAKKYPGCTISSGRGGYWVRTRGDICGCMTCDEEDRQRYEELTGDWAFPTFIVCETCGNKRCPRATHHANACTNSNEPGQPGSVYA